MTDPSNTPRRVLPPAWTTLTLDGAAMGAAFAGHASTHDGRATMPDNTIWLAQATEGGEGGEAGESGIVADGDDVVEFLADLGLIEGHLRAGVLALAGQETRAGEMRPVAADKG